MSAIQPPEIEPGLAVFLDPRFIRDRGDSLCNARLTATADYALTDTKSRYYLVLNSTSRPGHWLTTPLFTLKGKDRTYLDSSLKTGHNDQWREHESYFHRWTFWYLTSATIAVASCGERSLAGARNYYGRGDPAALDAVAVWATRNLNPFRPVPHLQPASGSVGNAPSDDR